MKTVMVGGALANKPNNGGEAWVRLSWLRGLQRLGFKVVLVEQIDADSCVDENGSVVAFEQSVNFAYFQKVIEQFGLQGSAVLVLGTGEATYGLDFGDLLDLAAEADLLVNISGHLTLEAVMKSIRRKAFIDIDPGFTQFWSAAGNPGAHFDQHDWWFSIGENIGKPYCPIPTGGIKWQPIRQPVVLSDWPVVEGCLDRFTTVANWRGTYGPVEFNGRTYGLKVHEFRKVIALPERSGQSFEIALSIHPGDGKDLDALRENGWRIVDPAAKAADPWQFRHYVQQSGAEFSVAQGVYVDTHSGWFSDRTIRYLASGKPVLVQSTGFDRQLPIGDGLLSFSCLDEAIAGADEIAKNYESHCRAARAIAEEYFDSDRILGDLIDRVGMRS
jgi:hypothetical protein